MTLAIRFPCSIDDPVDQGLIVVLREGIQMRKPHLKIIFGLLVWASQSQPLMRKMREARFWGVFWIRQGQRFQGPP